MDFRAAEAMFQHDKIRELADDPLGLRYLKLRSLSRGGLLGRLFQLANVPPPTRARDYFPQAFANSAFNDEIIETAIRDIYREGRQRRLEREPELVSQLYRLQMFDWGGLHQNSLEKTIVDNYVKRIVDYDELNTKIENDLHNSLRGYVLCSWYNHWTSIIIEDVFRDHPAVLPAVGQVKKIDFFVKDVPFDLKVTYLPEGFVKDKRREHSSRPELTLLKQLARRQQIHFSEDLPDGKLLEDLWAKHRDHPSSESQRLIQELNDFRLQTLSECQSDPTQLIRWLYENQGIRRFDASNRLFLVLVDRSNFFESWKLKRAKPLLDQSVSAFLDSVGEHPGRHVDFEWEGNSYSALADVVFVVHP